MAVKFEFYLSESDTERLFKVKNEYGKETMTGNDFAKYLLECEIHRLCPRKYNVEEAK